MKENYKGFNITSFPEKPDMYHHAARMGHEIDEIHETPSGWVYLSLKRWWDMKGEIVGFDWVV